jgi:uncharacterized protein YjlB
MPLKDQVKNYARKLIEKQPDPTAARKLVRRRTPLIRYFSDDGIVPNHPSWPLIVYRKVIRFSDEFDPATSIDTLFETNGWGRSWRDTIYDFVHYHSQTHEVLGVARGRAEVEFGGVKGRRLVLGAGDVAILPSGTGHRLLEASEDFLVVGAYPSSGIYDECTDSRDREKATRRIAKVRKPRSDPVYGKDTGLVALWQTRGKKQSG